MPSWDKWINEDKKPFKKKINKHLYCKKNRQPNGNYGKHDYPEGSKMCKLCGHIRKSFDNDNNDDSIYTKE